MARYRWSNAGDRGKAPAWQPLLGKLLGFAKMGLVPNRVKAGLWRGGKGGVQAEMVLARTSVDGMGWVLKD